MAIHLLTADVYENILISCVLSFSRLQAVIYELRQEEERLMNHIASLKQEEMQIGSIDLEALKTKDKEFSDVILWCTVLYCNRRLSDRKWVWFILEINRYQ